MQYIFLSHDVDWRKQGPPLEHILSRKDRFEPELFEKTKPEDLYRNIPDYMEIEEKFGVRSTFFFRTFYENGSLPDYKDDIILLEKGGWEIGLHTDPSSVNELEKIRLEKQRLEMLTTKPVMGNRIHYLKFNNELPEKLQKLGFVYDSSVRNSKDKIDKKEMGITRFGKLLEFPITLMDAYLFTYMKIPEEKIISTFESTLNFSRSLPQENNVITVIWHDNVLKMKGGRKYKQILEFLTSQDDVQIKRGVDLVKIFNE